MNRYLKNLKRIEFVITYDCTGMCRHCSEGDHPYTGVHIDSAVAESVVFAIAEKYGITSVMTFGGEPLMYPEAVFKVHSAATKVGIEKRQLITNGFFSKDEEQIKSVAKKLSQCGVNDILLSVDAFHQETIPLDVVKKFAREVKKYGLNIRTSPAWLVSKEDKNPYNTRTAEILQELDAEGISESSGNIIFPEGNARKNLSEYFDEDKEYINPYEENPDDIRSVSIEPDGTIFGENILEKGIVEILNNYKKQKKGV